MSAAPSAAGLAPGTGSVKRSGEIAGAGEAQAGSGAAAASVHGFGGSKFAPAESAGAAHSAYKTLGK